jgi:hypothetical protein
MQQLSTDLRHLCTYWHNGPGSEMYAASHGREFDPDALAQEALDTLHLFCPQGYSDHALKTLAATAWGLKQEDEATC